MTTPLPLLTDNRELHKAIELCKELRLDYEFMAQGDTDHTLLVRGTGAQKLAIRFQDGIKKGVIQGNMGPDGLRLVWDKGTAADTPHEDLYPVSQEKAEAVIALIPSRITSHEQLEKLCGQIRTALDEAFPGVKIHHRSHGKGKWLTLQSVMLMLWVRTDSILNRANMIILRELLCEMQTAEGLDYGRLTYPALPAAFVE